MRMVLLISQTVDCCSSNNNDVDGDNSCILKCRKVVSSAVQLAVNFKGKVRVKLSRF